MKLALIVATLLLATLVPGTVLAAPMTVEPMFDDATVLSTSELLARTQVQLDRALAQHSKNVEKVVRLRNALGGNGGLTARLDVHVDRQMMELELRTFQAAMVASLQDVRRLQEDLSVLGEQQKQEEELEAEARMAQFADDELPMDAQQLNNIVPMSGTVGGQQEDESYEFYYPDDPYPNMYVAARPPLARTRRVRKPSPTAMHALPARPRTAMSRAAAAYY